MHNLTAEDTWIGSFHFPGETCRVGRKSETKSNVRRKPYLCHVYATWNFESVWFSAQHVAQRK